MRLWTRSIFAIAGAFLLVPASARRARAEGLSDVEKTLVKSIDGQVGEAVSLLEKVVNIPSRQPQHRRCPRCRQGAGP